MTRQRGETHASAVLNPDKVRDIRRRLAGGEFQKLIAADYGVSTVSIHNIATGKTWKHVPMEEA